MPFGFALILFAGLWPEHACADVKVVTAFSPEQCKDAGLHVWKTVTMEIVDRKLRLRAIVGLVGDHSAFVENQTCDTTVQVVTAAGKPEPGPWDLPRFFGRRPTNEKAVHIRGAAAHKTRGLPFRAMAYPEIPLRPVIAEDIERNLPRFAAGELKLQVTTKIRWFDTKVDAWREDSVVLIGEVKSAAERELR